MWPSPLVCQSTLSSIRGSDAVMFQTDALDFFNEFGPGEKARCAATKYFD